MFDNIAPEINTQVNTNFMEERVLESHLAYPQTLMELPASVEKEMADGSWMAKHQLMKPVQIGQYTWSVSNPTATDIYTGQFPGMLAEKDSLALQTLRMYSFYKLSPIFRIQINSTPFHQGQLICTFDPFSVAQTDAIQSQQSNYNLYSATGFPHVRIMASNSDPVELKIPYTHLRSFLTTNAYQTFNNLGTFRITVLNPLKVGTDTSPNVTVTLWVYTNDAEVHVPISDHTPLLEYTEPPTPTQVEATSGKSRIPQLTDRRQTNPPARRAPQQNAPEPEKKNEPPKPSFGESLSEGFGHATKLFGNIVTGNWGQAFRSGHGLVGSILSLFGLDYPVDPLSPVNNIMPIENLAVVRGKSRAQRLCLDPYSLHKLDDDVAGESLNAMNLKHILQYPMLIQQFSFLSTSPIESLLFSTYVHPTISPQISTNTVDGVDYPVIQPTYLSFISNAFCYWTGGIKFDIEVVATRFHTGRLLFAYWPNTDRAPTYQEALQLPNVVVDIQQTSHFTFTVPYTSSTAMKSTTLYLEGNLSSSRVVDSANGMMVCYVQNLLTHPGSVSPDVQVNIYAYGDEDFNFFVMRRPYIDMLNVPTPPTEVEATSGISIESDAVSPSSTSVYLSKDQDHTSSRTVFGESYTLLDLIRRYSFYDIITSYRPNDKFPSIIIPVSPLNYSDNPAVNNKRTSMLHYWSSIYTTWAGSVRYKFVFPAPRSSGQLGVVTHYPDIFSSDLLQQEYLSNDAQYASNGYGSHLTTFSQNNALEVDVPWYSRYNMLLIHPSRAISTVSNTLYTINGYIRLFVNQLYNTPDNTADGAYPAQIYIAAGEDFRFIYLRPPPPNRILTTMYYYPIST